ncbi:MAG: Non-canonical purine NTP pyrophosphatase [Alphaproteobacteria bacterium ADurb.Bin438]|nr:MAG: Non-canonical purine NTP pyrophosphatase [Alphaproteobacteria bacterium ADurb.Bin438]
MPLDKMVLATHNQGKIDEFKKMVRGYRVQVFTANETEFSDVDETGTTFKENALLKARAVAKECGIPALADDSGFCLRALNGGPGVLSARSYDVKEKGYPQAFERIAKILLEKKDIAAMFKCVLILAYPDGKYKMFDGTVEGKFVYPPRGTNGFGYDPVFLPNGHDKTFAEMEDRLKNEISHRAIAFKKFMLEML